MTSQKPSSVLHQKLRDFNSWDKIVRLDKYPVHDLESLAARKLIDAGRENMARLGAGSH
jgi:hypothetical protein